MAALALEYKESLAIEKSIATDQQIRERWTKRQETFEGSMEFEEEE